MKRNFLSLACVLIMSALALLSCSGGNDGTDGNINKGNEVYVQGTVMRIVTAYDTNFGLTAELTAAVKSATGILPQSILDVSGAAAHEIIVGHTSRELTSLAEGYMNGLGIVSNDTSVYCIYAKGGSVAIVWSHDIDALERLAIDRLISDLLSAESLYLEDGVVCYGTFDRRAHENAREAALRESQLAEVERVLGKDAREAMADYLETYTDDYYIWLANLYDPEIGGFYYANSGRDTEGFLPDIESTVQALSWIQEVGFLEFYGGNLALGLPEWMKEQIIGFAQSLQSSVDGYFYHPQWGNNITDSRKGRDLDWAVRIIPELGGQILYDTPSGIKGSLGAPSGVTPTAASLTSPLVRDTASACASAVASTASNIPAHLSSLSAFRSYLESFDWENDSYTAGHTSGTQCSQVRNRGEEYVDLFIGFLNEKQEAAQQRLRAAGKAENGLWEDRVSYDSVNGLMKISGIYNDLGAKIPYAEQALASAISLVEFEGVDVEGKRASNAVDVFNPLYAIGNLFTNISKYYEGDEADYYRGILRENAASIISATKRKSTVFAKPDGAYGYNDSKVTADSQGAPVAIEGINESDVNGAGMVTNGIFRCMCNALGITPLYRYFNSDYEKFLSIIENLDPVTKNTDALASEPITFDSDPIGTSDPENISTEMNAGGVRVIDDPRAGVVGNVLEFVTVGGSSSKITTNVIGNGNGNCFVLEWDMNIKQSKVNTVAMRAKVGYAYMINVKTASNGFVIGDSAGTSGSVIEQWFDGTYSYDKWYTFRIEHYTGDAESVRSVIYVNGRKIAESDNYYGKIAGSEVNPLSLYKNAVFYALFSSDMTVYFDNIRAERLEKSYVGDQPDKPALSTVGVVDFDGSAQIPTSLSCNTNGEQGSAFSVIDDPTSQGGDNKVLHMTAAGAPVGGTGNSVKQTSVWSESESANCYVASADLYFVSVPQTTAFQFFIRNGDNRNIYCLNFDTKTDSDGKRYLRIYEKPEGDVTSATIVDWFDVSDWVNIRVEYYKDKKIAKIYINDVCVAENGAFWSLANATADFTLLAFAALRATTADLYIDNLTAQKVVKAYYPEN